MKLRVVVPTLGRSDHLSDTLHSIRVLANTVDLHCLVVAPSAVSKQLAERFAVDVLSEPEGFTGGLYGAINIAASEPGDWDWITYINDDDGLVTPWRDLPGERADIVYGRVLLKYGESERLTPLSVCDAPSRLPGIWVWGAPGLYQQGTIISRRAFHALGGFDSSYRFAADHAFWLMASKAGFEFAFRDEAVAFFRVRSGQLSGDRRRMAAEIARATRAADLSVGYPDALFSWLYWRSRSLRAALSRLRRGLPLRVTPGSSL